MPRPFSRRKEPALSEVEGVGDADRGHQLGPNPRQSSSASPVAPLNRAFRLSQRDDTSQAESSRLLASTPGPAAALTPNAGFACNVFPHLSYLYHPECKFAGPEMLICSVTKGGIENHALA